MKRMIKRLLCLLGKHAPGKWSIDIQRVNHDTKCIDYRNKFVCSRCGAELETDEHSQGDFPL